MIGECSTLGLGSDGKTLLLQINNLVFTFSPVWRLFSNGGHWGHWEAVLPSFEEADTITPPRKCFCMFMGAYWKKEAKLPTRLPPLTQGWYGSTKGFGKFPPGFLKSVRTQFGFNYRNPYKLWKYPGYVIRSTHLFLYIIATWWDHWKWGQWRGNQRRL